MNAKELFLERHDGLREYPERLVAGLTEERLRTSPHPNLNPIAWSLWHIVRCEDVGVHRILNDETQELDLGEWTARLGVSERSIGTGMTKKQVARLSEEIDLAALTAYRVAVSDRTRDVVRGMDEASLSRRLGVGALRKVLEVEGAGGEAAAELVAAYQGQRRGWLLGHLGLTHSYYHVGQAFGVRALWGVPNPW